MLSVPLSGPAYLVSHGGAAFPDLVVVLQGEGVTIDLIGHTDIKKGITYSRFESVPDAPVSSFELKLPEGPYSALAANGSLCALTRTVTLTRHVTRRARGHTRRVTVRVKKSVSQPLLMATTITAQNGKQVVQDTKVAVTGCTPAKAKPARSPRKSRKAKRGNQRKP